ncbi:hypothetical protein [Lutispora sp.]|uniref:hypothetical protein n=1 Tax=Lutispora sp. TaxID=2828727 RepID=UPI003569CA53
MNLNPQNPYLQAGSINRLLEQEKLQHVKKCVIIVHSIRHGDIESLELLKKELENKEIKYKIVDFGELE